MPLPVIQPSRVTVMIKPVGALCNLDCVYCYYLPTKTIYEGHEHRMSLRTLEEVFAGILPRFADEVTIAWQGGEPTLAGLPFFRKALEFQEKYRRPHQRVSHALQTNGTLLDDDWCVFLREHQFLVGLSVDGPEHFHNHYRVTNRKRPSFDQVMRGHRLLQKHAVEYNILCVLNDHNVDYPEEILAFLLNLGSRWVQFIPAIEWVKDETDPSRNALAPYSPQPEPYGRFLCRVFDLWFERYRKRLSVRDFDAVLNRLVVGQMPYCILDGACHNQLTIEHDGAVFGCDHFVERRWQLARIGEPGWFNAIRLDGGQNVGLTVHGTGYAPNNVHAGRDIDTTEDLETRYSAEHDAAKPLDDGWFTRCDTDRLGAFSQRKQFLPPACDACEWRAYCHGGCPKHRPAGGEIPEPTILCESYKMFYAHAMPRLRWLAGFLRAGVMPPDPGQHEPVGTTFPPAGAAGLRVPGNPGAPGDPGDPGVPGRRAMPTGGRQSAENPMPWRERVTAGAGAKVRRNDPCPCGSGLKYKRCHGRS